MKSPTYHTYLTDPAVRERLDAAARGFRAQAVQRYLFAPIARFCGKLVSIRAVGMRLDPRI